MIESHKHCPICGTPIPLDEKVCSPDCEKVWNQRLEKGKKSRITLLILLVIFILVWAFMTFLR
jgi:predicted nucleic acid-binding Zn ribbon protein